MDTWIIILIILVVVFIFINMSSSRLLDVGELVRRPSSQPIEKFENIKPWKDVSSSCNCDGPTFENPYMNVMPGDYLKNSQRPRACYSKEELADVMMFGNFPDVFNRRFAERSFYSNPVTTIPNDQTAFAQSLFRPEESCKLNPANCYRYEDLRFNQVNPFDWDIEENPLP